VYTFCVLNSPTVGHWNSHDIQISYCGIYFHNCCSFFKFNVSTMCPYKIMKQKISERPIIRVHMFDYCDISLRPTTALTASLITDVSYCHVGWICTAFASSRVLWMNELCNKSYLFFQIDCKIFNLVQTMQSSLTRLYHWKYCSNSSGTYCRCSFQY
jgi:hypothetical protein